jgi:hypothetical protein
MYVGISNWNALRKELVEVFVDTISGYYPTDRGQLNANNLNHHCRSRSEFQFQKGQRKKRPITIPRQRGELLMALDVRKLRI